jgi:Phosphopantetheine attachment site
MDLRTVSPLQQVLAKFWDEALGRNASDRLTDFFKAGGTDALAARLLSRVEDAFHVEMPLASLRSAPTVAAFAELLKQQVDHPGRLERLAERLLHEAHPARAARRESEGAGASW